jgi:hypothetical protein
MVLTLVPLLYWCGPCWVVAVVYAAVVYAAVAAGTFWDGWSGNDFGIMAGTDRARLSGKTGTALSQEMATKCRKRIGLVYSLSAAAAMYQELQRSQSSHSQDGKGDTHGPVVALSLAGSQSARWSRCRCLGFLSRGLPNWLAATCSLGPKTF